MTRPLVLMSGLAVGGAERVTVRFLERLAEQGRTVPLCTVTSRHDQSPARAVEAAGVPRHDLGARRLADPRALARLRSLLRQEEITVLHAHGQDATVLGWAATRGAPAAFTATRHVLEEPADDWRQRLRARLVLAAFRGADAPVAVSRATADRLSQETGLRRDAVRVIYNGVDLRSFHSPEDGDAGDASGDGTRRTTRRALGLDAGAPVVLVPAVLRQGKGHETLLEALPALRERVPSVRILLAGGGEREEALRARAAGADLTDHVLFLGHRDDVPALLRAADVVALPSRAEALPTVLIEAAAAGRPVVATRVGGTPEVVEEGRTGLLVPPDAPDALARALAELLADPERARRMGRAARRRAKERFDLDRQVQETVALWRELSADAGGGDG